MKKLFFILLALNLNILNAKELIKLGAIAGSDSQIAEAVKKVAKDKYNLDIKVIEVNGININEILDIGDIDANAVQHQPYLNESIKERNYKIVSVGNTYSTPMGIFSKKIKNLNELKEGFKIGIPNNPTHAARALLLLQNSGIIKLKSNSGALASSFDIIENPKKIKLIELELAQLPRSLIDLDIAVINITYALNGGLSLNDSLAIEDKESPYINNVLVVQEKNKDKPWVNQLLKSYQSKEITNFIKETFKGAIVPSF